jgi:YggT family protein
MPANVYPAEPFFNLVVMLINAFLFVLLINIVLSWLINFDVLDRRNALVQQIYRGTGALTEPVLRPIRRMLPALGGMDLSPMVLGISLIFLIQLCAMLLAGAGLLPPYR